MNPDISIITPCFNQGQYLDEAIESIIAINTPYTYEHIIVNDGSTDVFTIKKIEELASKGHIIIQQENMGLATARNNAISIAKGKYILPLDADNKLEKSYLTTAIELLEKEPTIDVIYSDAIFFDKQNRVVTNKQFEITKILKSNYIDACAIIRMDMFDKTLGYDPSMPFMGHEDWELWVNIFFKGGKFYYLSEVGYYYRVTENSMRLRLTQQMAATNRNYIIKKHASFFYEFFINNYERIEYLKKHRLKASTNILLGRIF